MTYFRFKLMLLGPAAVGKTSLMHRFVKNEFKANYMLTIGVEFLTKELNFKKDTVKLQVWDVGGQERFKGVRKQFYAGATGALLLYDVTREQTYKALEEWVKEMQDVLGQDIPFILIGNKADLLEETGRIIEKGEVEEFAKQNGSIYIETSAKTGENVEEAFIKLTKLMAERKGNKLK